MWHKKHKRTKKVSYEINLPLWLYLKLLEIAEFENVSLSAIIECGILYANGWEFERSKRTLKTNLRKAKKKSKNYPKKKGGEAYQQGIFKL